MHQKEKDDGKNSKSGFIPRVIINEGKLTKPQTQLIEFFDYQIYSNLIE